MWQMKLEKKLKKVGLTRQTFGLSGWVQQIRAQGKILEFILRVLGNH